MSDINLIKAIRLHSPETIPVFINVLPKAWFEYGEKLQKITDRYPQFFFGQKFDPEQIRATMLPRYRAGTWTDEWGCVFHNNTEGMDGIVMDHPIQSGEDICDLRIPDDRSGDMLPHGFMYLRLLDLCGFENAMILFAEEEEPLRVLLDKVTEYNLYQVAALSRKVEDIAWFGDDLGMQHGLAIGAEKWRKYLKPCFRKIYGVLKAARPDVLIYMHTDGCIYEIMPDLVECGVDIINPQFRANGLDNLIRVCRQEQIIPINLDLDRQMMPFATPAEIHDHVEQCVSSLYLPQGGLCINVELNHDYPLENIEALLAAVEKFRHFRR